MRRFYCDKFGDIHTVNRHFNHVYSYACPLLVQQICGSRGSDHWWVTGHGSQDV